MSTNLSQNVLPTRSLDSTAAPCRPVYVHLDRFGYATYSFATATAWILFDAFGTARLTVSLSTSLKRPGILVYLRGLCRGSEGAAVLPTSPVWSGISVASCLGVQVEQSRRQAALRDVHQGFSVLCQAIEVQPALLIRDIL
jgi:hypothetical protein